jgi:hypothetical protein
MKDIDSWKPTSYETRFRAKEHSEIFPRIPIRYIGGRSDKNQVSRSRKETQVCWKRSQKSAENSRRQTRSQDSRSPVRMERVLGSHLL